MNRIAACLIALLLTSSGALAQGGPNYAIVPLSAAFMTGLNEIFHRAIIVDRRSNILYLCLAAFKRKAPNVSSCIRYAPPGLTLKPDTVVGGTGTVYPVGSPARVEFPVVWFVDDTGLVQACAVNNPNIPIANMCINLGFMK